MKVSLTLTIEPELVAAVNKVAKDNDLTTSQAIALLIKLALKDGTEIKNLVRASGQGT